jgi:hypothetical protein
VTPPGRPTGPAGSVVVPAHNEESVLARTLEGLAGLVAGGTEVVVAANGCTDRTVEVAGRFPGVRVLDLPAPGKTAALNAADSVLTQWPRLSLDADIEISPESVHDVFGALSGSGACLAARPAARVDTSSASWVVRRHYAARERLATNARSLWGAGAYAVTERGHARFDRFPDVVADDLFVDALFSPDEVAVVDTEPVLVRAPRTLTGLLAISRRTARGNAELRAGSGVPDTSLGTARALTRSVRGPVSLVDALVYTGVVVVGRRRALRPGSTWDRDDSSR